MVAGGLYIEGEFGTFAGGVRSSGEVEEDQPPHHHGLTGRKLLERMGR
jgi:hypothetical protein